MVGLKNDFVLFFCLVCLFGDLGIKLSEMFCGVEISGKQCFVDIQQGDESDVWEVVFFGQYLGVNQNMCFVVMDGGEMFFQCFFVVGGIVVDM